MSGAIKKTEIVEADLGQLSDDLRKVGESISFIISESAKVKPITGLSDLAKITKETATNARNLAIQQKAILDIEAKVITVIEKEAKARAAETQATIKQTQAIKSEQQAKQSKITTDTKVINQIKAEQQAKNTEIQARIKNAQAIAAEERATQSGIRTKRLEQNEHRKTTSSFTKLAYSLRTYIAAYASFQSLMSVVSSVFKQTKALDSLSFSMRTIISDANELAQTHVFLSETSKNYGLDLLSISERYARFRAATIQSNMTAKDTQKIFDSVSRSAAVLGLRTDEVAGVYLALEQMISKGKVTTEELRRQLGERLSGAFGIFAAAIGVSTSKLDEMLKKGQILSAEVLPKFADQLLKAYGIENVTRVDNLAAAQGRLNTQWTEFIDSLEASSMFAGVFNVLADSLGRINNAIKSDNNKTTERSVKLITESVDKLSEANTVQERQEILTKSILDLEQRRAKVSEQLIKDEGKRPGFLDKTISGLNQALGLGGQFTSSILFEQVYQDTVLDEKAYKKAIDNLKKNFNKLVIPPIVTKKVTPGETDKEYNKRIRIEKERNEKRLAEFDLFQKEELAIQEEHLSTTYKNEVDYDSALDATKSENKQNRLDFEISLQEELLKKVRKGSVDEAAIISDISKLRMDKEKESVDFQIKERENGRQRAKKLLLDEKADRKKLTEDTISNSVAQADKEKLSAQEVAIEDIKAANHSKTEIQKIHHELTLFMIDEDIKAQQRIIDTANLEPNAYEQASKRLRQLRLQRGEEDIAWTEQTEDNKRQKFEDTARATNELLQQGLEFSKMIYSAQAERAQATYDAEMMAAGDSLEYQTLAKRKFEAEDKKIKQRQAIASKLQAVLEAGLALTLAIATTWKNPLLAALNISAATIGLGMALATPIPQFAEGTDFAPSSFIAGEEGSELIRTKSGKMILTPNKATLFSDNSLIGSSVTPADETQRMLANMAFNQVREVVDMRETNTHLSGIEKNTRNRESKYIDSKGRTVVKRGTVNSIL